jgi:hypothetical protein
MIIALLTLKIRFVLTAKGFGGGFVPVAKLRAFPGPGCPAGSRMAPGSFRGVFDASLIFFRRISSDLRELPRSFAGPLPWSALLRV